MTTSRGWLNGKDFLTRHQQILLMRRSKGISWMFRIQRQEQKQSKAKQKYRLDTEAVAHKEKVMTHDEIRQTCTRCISVNYADNPCGVYERMQAGGNTLEKLCAQERYRRDAHDPSIGRSEQIVNVADLCICTCGGLYWRRKYLKDQCCPLCQTLTEFGRSPTVMEVRARLARAPHYLGQIVSQVVDISPVQADSSSQIQPSEHCVQSSDHDLKKTLTRALELDLPVHELGLCKDTRWANGQSFNLGNDREYLDYCRVKAGQEPVAGWVKHVQSLVGEKALPAMQLSEWSSEFEQLMRNRLIMGGLRYGMFKDNGKKPYDRVGSISKRLKLFKETGNTELLVDIANFAMLEFLAAGGGAKMQSIDDGDHHTELKG